jgi:aspartyl-tRNA(Asn)/glutamyl-tRNA(Gln) amidotransferase subunit C
VPDGISRNDVLAIAALAELELDAAEVEMFTKQLAEILAYATEIRQLDTTGIPPTASVLFRAPAERGDEPRPSLDRDAALANAPEAAAGLFKVPRVIG